MPSTLPNTVLSIPLTRVPRLLTGPPVTRSLFPYACSGLFTVPTYRVRDPVQSWTDTEDPLPRPVQSRNSPPPRFTLELPEGTDE